MSLDNSKNIERAVNDMEVITPQEWLEDKKIEGVEEKCSQAVLCLEHLIERHYKEQSIKILEVGPVPTLWNKAPELVKNHKAPISLLSERNKQLECFAIGHHNIPEEIRKNFLGDVEYIQGILDPFQDEYLNMLVKKFKGNPDIIYGQHVFENSPASINSLPVGPYKPFEASAKMLASGGFIVVDNAGGQKSQIGIPKNWPISKIMKLAYSYNYSEKEAIYVFQKSAAKY
jgi:hypothetical protein